LRLSTITATINTSNPSAIGRNHFTHRGVPDATGAVVAASGFAVTVDLPADFAESELTPLAVTAGAVTVKAKGLLSILNGPLNSTEAV